MSTDSDRPTLPVDALERINRVCLDFEAAWKKGESPRIEDYLGDVRGDERSKLLQELILLEFEYRRQEGESPTREEYARRFPDERSTVDTAMPSSPEEDHPDNVGPYKILEVLGEGGMGVVYLAEQKEPVERRVALKLIKLGLDTKEVIARFEAERQALAMMDHPNIARVYDAGATPDGRPYFVMEHVRGVPLAEYCERYRLTVKDRLQVFLQICRGVEHAHRQGIIHRDIKPSNIVVSTPDGRPVAKIIDFGLAKAVNRRLTEKTVYTALGQAVGTLAYMSPEQAEMTGEGVDPSSWMSGRRRSTRSCGASGRMSRSPRALAGAGSTRNVRRGSPLNARQRPRATSTSSVANSTGSASSRSRRSRTGGTRRQAFWRKTSPTISIKSRCSRGLPAGSTA